MTIDTHTSITLRPFCGADWPIMGKLLTDPIIGKNYMLPDYPDSQAAKPLFQRMIALSMDEERYVRGIFAGKQLIGFLNDTEIDGDTIELGYVIDPALHGQGYMTQALTMAIQELFSLGYRKVVAGAFEENAPSIRVMEKCGMHRLTQTDTITYRGKTHLCIYYAIEKQE